MVIPPPLGCEVAGRDWAWGSSGASASGLKVPPCGAALHPRHTKCYRSVTPSVTEASRQVLQKRHV
eukprot:4556904-Pyramimonas_sp.AAC.1